MTEFMCSNIPFGKDCILGWNAGKHGRWKKRGYIVWVALVMTHILVSVAMEQQLTNPSTANPVPARFCDIVFMRK